MKTRTGSRQTVLTRAVSEAMERRVLLAFNNALVNDPTRDPVGINGSFNTQSETASLAFTPLNTTEHYVVSAYNDTGEGLNGQHGMGWALSIDGGRTFTDKPTLPYSTDRSQGLRGESGDAVLARDTFSGTIYLAANSRPLGAVPGTQVFRSTDNGATFAAPVTALTGISGATFIDKPWIAVDNADPTRPGNVYLMAMVGLSTGNRNLVFCRSIDFGSTWSMPITILSAPSGATTSGVGANVVVGADHKVYAFYRQQSTIFGSSYEVRRSTDFGLSFGPAGRVSTAGGSGSVGLLSLVFDANGFVQAVANPADENQVFVVYARNNDPDTDRGDIFLVSTNNGGSTWSSPVRVNDDITLRDQWQPSLSIKPDGPQLFVGWYDRREDADDNPDTRDDNLIGVFGRIGNITSSGVSFQQNSFRISTQSFDPYFGKDDQLRPLYMSDYDQATADSTGFYHSWGDNRDADAESATNQGPNVRLQRIPSISGTTAGETITISRSSGGTDIQAHVGSTLVYTELYTNATTTIIIDGREGDDTIGVDTTNGAIGVDLIIYGGDGSDALTGGTGNDTIDGGVGADSISGGGGKDTADYAIRTAAVTVTLDGIANDGASENDNITSSIEVVRGGRGADSLAVGSYAAALVGGPGDDEILGSYANPQFATAGFDDDPNAVSADLMIGFAADGYGGSDSLVDIHQFSGSPFDDSIFGSLAADTIFGNAGNDTIEGGEGSDSMVGGRGDDVYLFDDQLISQEQFVMGGDEGLDSFGNPGDDANPSLGSDTISENDDLDRDLLDFSEIIEPVIVNLATHSTSSSQIVATTSLEVHLYLQLRSESGAGTGNGIEDVVGSDNADSITGNARGNTLRGGAAGDTLTGGAGDDTLVGGAGADSMLGETGIDTADYSDRTAALTITINDTANDGASGEYDNVKTDIENIVGGGANDTITGSTGNNIIDGGLGADSIDGGSGSDTIDYTSGRATGVSITLGGLNSDSDVLTSIENATGSPFDDTIVGGTSAETLSGGGGNDALTGNGGDDFLSGGADNDTIIGNAGVDAMNGGQGDDSLIAAANDPISGLVGGSGKDTLDYTAETTSVVITVPQQIQVVVGGIGDDSIDATGHPGRVTLQGGVGTDSLIGAGGADSLVGGDGNDTLRGLGGNDTLKGNDGNDSLIGGVGRDSVEGGNDNDYFDAQDDEIDILRGDGGTDSVLGDLFDSLDTIEVTLPG